MIELEDIVENTLQIQPVTSFCIGITVGILTRLIQNYIINYESINKPRWDCLGSFTYGMIIALQDQNEASLCSALLSTTLVVSSTMTGDYLGTRIIDSIKY